MFGAGEGDDGQGRVPGRHSDAEGQDGVRDSGGDAAEGNCRALLAEEYVLAEARRGIRASGAVAGCDAR